MLPMHTSPHHAKGWDRGQPSPSWGLGTRRARGTRLLTACTSPSPPASFLPATTWPGLTQLHRDGMETFPKEWG